MNLTTIHCEQDAWTPVEESLGYGISHNANCLAGQPAKVKCCLVVGVQGKVFQHHGDTLDRLLTERALCCCELECVADLVGQVSYSGGASVEVVVLRVSLLVFGKSIWNR